MEQSVLTIKIGRGKIISKHWDFEALCLIDDNIEKNGVIAKCINSVSYLFEGTSATDEYLLSLSPKRIYELCETVWGWYIRDILTLKIEKSDSDKSKGKTKLRDMYADIFKTWGTLPDEIGRQRPRNVFHLLSNLGEKEPDADELISNLPETSKVFYVL